MAIFLSVLYLLVVLFFFKRKRNKRILLTPTFCLGIPYGVVMLLVSIYDVFNNANDFHMSPLVPLISIFLFFIFMLGGAYFFKNAKVSKFRFIHKHSRPYIRVMLYALLLLLVAVYISNFSFTLPDSTVMKELFSTGASGHIVNIITALFICISIYINSVPFILLSLLWLVTLTLFAAKYMMFIYAIALLVIYSIKQPRLFSLRNIVISVILIAGLFFLTYMLRFITQGYTISTIPYDFIINHFMYYLFGAFYAFSKVLTEVVTPTEGVGFGIVFAPIMNVFSVFTGSEYVTSISRFIDVPIMSNYSSTNTYTLYGSIYLETNMAFLIFFILVLGFICFGLYYKVFSRNHQKLLPLYAFFMGTIFFSFFNCFYGTLNLWELAIYLILLSFLPIEKRVRTMEPSKAQVAPINQSI